MASDESQAILALVQRHLTPFIRTDFSDDQLWRRIEKAAAAPVKFGVMDGDPEPDDGYIPGIHPVDNPVFLDVTAHQLLRHLGGPLQHADARAILVDSRTVQEASQSFPSASVEYVDLTTTSPSTFRCLISSIATVDVNLAIGNLYFDEFTSGDAVYGA
jgi:hypothetical protein